MWIKLSDAIKNKNSFAWSLSSSILGSVLVQVMYLMSIPIISRYYTPDAIGENAFFASIIYSIGVVASGRYDQAVLLPTDQLSAMSVVLGGVIVSFFVAFGSMIFSLLGSVLHWKGFSTIFIWAIPISVFSVGVSNVFSSWLLREQKLLWISFGRIACVIVTGMFAISMAVVGRSNSFSLTVATCLGFITSSLVYTFLVLWKSKKIVVTALTLENIWYVLRLYWKFPLVEGWGVLLDGFSYNAPVILFNYAFGSYYVGLWDLAYKVLIAPAGLIHNSVSQVFFSRASALHRNGFSIINFTNKVYWFLIFIAAPPLLLICLHGQFLFSMLFGEQWKDSGLIAQILSPAIFCMILYTPLSSISTILEKQTQALIARFFSFSFRVIPLFFCLQIFPNSFNLAVEVFSFCISLMYLSLSVWSKSLIKINKSV